MTSGRTENVSGRTRLMTEEVKFATPGNWSDRMIAFTTSNCHPIFGPFFGFDSIHCKRIFLMRIARFNKVPDISYRQPTTCDSLCETHSPVLRRITFTVLEKTLLAQQASHTFLYSLCLCSTSNLGKICQNNNS